MIGIAFFLSTWKVIIKSFDSVLDILHSSLYETFLTRGMNMVVEFQKLHACGYHVPPSVDTGCFPYSSTMSRRKRSATNIFLSLDIFVRRIAWVLGSMAIHSQRSSEPTLICVSSMINCTIFLFDDIL